MLEKIFMFNVGKNFQHTYYLTYISGSQTWVKNVGESGGEFNEIWRYPASYLRLGSGLGLNSWHHAGILATRSRFMM